MKILCGTDIIEINRIEKAIKNIGYRFIDKIYTEKEIEYCESKKQQKYQHYAARFAAKEATFKAISELLKNSISLKNIEIIKKDNSKPYINLIEVELKDLIDIEVSISHCKEYANAIVVCSKK